MGRGLGDIPTNLGVLAFPNVCSIMVADDTQAGSGQPTPVLTPLAGHADLPCRMAPLIKERPTGVEERKEGYDAQTNQFHLIFNRKHAEILPTHVARVDNVDYNIVAVDHNASGLYTRLRLEKITV